MFKRKVIKISVILLLSCCMLLPNLCFSDDIQLSVAELNLSTRELNWIKENKSIKIAGPKSFPPFHYYDEHGRLKGISADYIFMIMNQIGIKLEIQEELQWPEVLKKIQAKEIDLIPCIAKTPDRELFIEFSVPYISFPLVILSRKDAPFIGGIEDLYGKKLSIITENAIIDWLKGDKIKFEPVYVDSPVKGLEALSLGRVDASIENLATASFIIQKYGLMNIKIAAPTPYGNYDLHMGVRKNLPELLGIINKVVDFITPEQHMQIRSKWLSVRYEHGIRKSEVVKWTVAIAIVAFIIITIILIWNKKLNDEIDKRKIIIKELEKAFTEIKTLRGIVPICSSCKKIRDDKGYWNLLENYIEKNSEASFTHGMCPACMEKFYGEKEWYIKSKKNKTLKCNP